MRRNNDFIGIGNKNSLPCIEGLLPERVNSAVFASHSNLVNRAIGGDKKAKDELKRVKLEEFKRVSKPGNEDFAEFYALAKVINKAMKRQQEGSGNGNS